MLFISINGFFVLIVKFKYDIVDSHNILIIEVKKKKNLRIFNIFIYYFIIRFYFFKRIKISFYLIIIQLNN